MTHARKPERTTASASGSSTPTSARGYHDRPSDLADLEAAKTDAWVARRLTDGGWAGIQVLSAEDLSTWLSQCPGVLGWFEERLGRNPHGRVALRDWWVSWANQTEPPIPPALLLAGRHADAETLVTGVSGSATEQVIATRTEDEAIAFLAAALLADRTALGNGGEEGEAAHPRDADVSRREALLERTVVVHDGNAWRSLITHHESLVLVPTSRCLDPAIDAAVTQGHHVVLPRVARPGEAALSKLDRSDARVAWEEAGLPFDKADALARAARRSLASLRRRHGRAGRLRAPAWANGTSATLLGPLLLAGSWNATHDGDQRIALELADRSTLRSLTRDLHLIAADQDPPLLQRGDVWEFVDPIDAWDALGATITAEDLDLFHEHAIEILAYRDPSTDLGPAERLAASLEGTLPPPEYSENLRRGAAETLAILGAIRGDAVLPGGQTGAERAGTTVYRLLDGATAERWLGIAGVLPTLAEGAPATVMDAIEASLGEADRPILALFNEQDDALGLSPSASHTPLLWALETLAFSPVYLSRVAVVLGQLAELDPGGRLLNRPKNSLRDILHPITPQSAVDTASRLAAIDAVRQTAPEAAWGLLGDLIEALDQGMTFNHGPRYHDWPRAQPPTQADVFETVLGIGERFVADASAAPGRLAHVLKYVTRVPATVRARMLQVAAEAWDQRPDEERRAIVAELRKEADRHARFRDSAWAVDDAGLAEITSFIDAHAGEADETGDHLLFTYCPDLPGIDPDTDEGKEALRVAREAAVRNVLPDDLGPLASASVLPEQVGVTLAAITTNHDHVVLGWLSHPEEHLRRAGYGLARARQEATDGWLLDTVAARGDLAVELLLTGNMTDELIDHVDHLADEIQAEFWSRTNPWSADPSTRITVAERLLAHDRPYTAMNLLGREDAEGFPVDLGLAALTKPLSGTEEDISVLDSPAYTLRGMLDRLDEGGAPVDRLATLEWFYNPALHHERRPKALHRILAENAVLFAQLVALTTSEDDASDATDETDDQAEVVADTEENRENAFWVLREWTLPLPGSTGTGPPDTAALQGWVDSARHQLAVRRRSTSAGHAIGQAMSGPAYDPDGTWPCQAVRDVLQYEDDRDLEEGMWLGRVNGRGVTVRGAYSGGKQERTLEAQYREWADNVRSRWPRSGALLDSIAGHYESDARRQDGSADRHGDM